MGGTAQPPTLLIIPPLPLWPAGKPAVDAAPGAGPARPSWVREEAGSAWTLLAANFPQMVAAAELADGGLWGPWMAATEGGEGQRGVGGRAATAAAVFSMAVGPSGAVAKASCSGHSSVTGL